ncbi:TPA: hypothetical protein ACSTJ0_003825 [Serratia fonticola]
MTNNDYQATGMVIQVYVLAVKTNNKASVSKHFLHIVFDLDHFINNLP